MESREIRVLRQQAWQRAKGELLSILVTYWSDDGDDSAFNKIDALIAEFIKTVDDEALLE